MPHQYQQQIVDATPVPASDDDAANADGDDAAAATAADMMPHQYQDVAAQAPAAPTTLPVLPFQLLRPLLIQQQYLL